MTQSEQNKEFGKMLAHSFYGSTMNTLPITLNSEQYEAFKEELTRLSEDKKLKRYK